MWSLCCAGGYAPRQAWSLPSKGGAQLRLQTGPEPRKFTLQPQGSDVRDPGAARSVLGFWAKASFLLPGSEPAGPSLCPRKAKKQSVLCALQCLCLKGTSPGPRNFIGTHPLPNTIC